MLDASAMEALTRSLMLGTARQALPVARAFDGLIEPADPKATLKALALLAQRNRFRRPAPMPPPASEPLFVDARALVPPTARALLVSLMSGKNGNPSDAIALALADTMARKLLRLHPFDLPRLDAFVRLHAETLGASAVAWAERHAKTTEDVSSPYSFAEEIDEANWMQGRPAQKTAFIRALRMTAPDRARELVEAGLPSEPAPVRVALLQALAQRLSPADAPFLETLARDRAPSVRETAEGLLARLPGSPQAQKRLQECLSRIKTAKAGLLRRRTILQIDYPATVKEAEREGWAIATFGSVGLDELARALTLSIDDLTAAVADDPILVRVLALRASQERRFEMLAKLARGGAADAWSMIVQAPDPGISDPGSAATWSAAAVQPDLWPEMPGAASLTQLYERLRNPLPESTAARLLASDAWRSFIESAGHPDQPRPTDRIVAIAPLIPPSLRPELRAMLAPLEPSVTARACDAMLLLDQIEAA